jgi:SAM-dependent methyltransferase
VAFSLDKVVPWGRSFPEYVNMFALSAGDCQKRILGVGDGPASFNAVLSSRGGNVVSVDPLYRFSAAEIRQRIGETFDAVLAQTRENAAEFIWTHIHSVEELGRLRMSAMEEFLADFSGGRQQGRYREAGLPRLPFATNEFDLALCSHFLFLYSELLSLEFHLESIKELCRVASEARIFPILELGARPSRHLDQVTEHLENNGFHVEIASVPYEFQKGGNRMLKVRSSREPAAAKKPFVHGQNSLEV